MANSNESKWYYLSGTIYYIAAIVGILSAVLFKYCPSQPPPQPTTTTTVQTPTQDTCKALEQALNQWVQNAGGDLAMMQLLGTETKAHRQLADDSIMEEGLLSDYLQKLRIQPMPLHIQDCQWDAAHQHIQVVLFKDK